MVKTLIVEDNHDFRGSLKGLLSARFPDLLIVEAGNAADALRVFTRLHPDVAFIDINLPGGMNGLGLIERIRNANSRVRIIIITNYDLPEYRDASARLGADHFLPKASTTGEDIVAVMRSVISTVGDNTSGH